MDHDIGGAWQVQRQHWARHLRDLQLTAQAVHAYVREVCARVTAQSRRDPHDASDACR
jgi:hypothetical protein